MSDIILGVDNCHLQRQVRMRRIIAEGMKTDKGSIPVDVIVLATGF